MSRNRVEELESTVAELESTIEGLTDELVEAKERIRVLEAELDTDAPTRVPERRRGDSPDATADTGEAQPDDMEAAPAETETTQEPDSTNETEESRTDDIIVA